MDPKINSADERNATLTLILKADSGYNSKSTGYRISPNQWAKIIAIAEGKPLPPDVIIP